jgi:F-type H+-transporting ATPase subunit gamma
MNRSLRDDDIAELAAAVESDSAILMVQDTENGPWCDYAELDLSIYTSIHIKGVSDTRFWCQVAGRSPKTKSDHIQLLPIEPPQEEDGATGSAKEYEFEPNPEDLLGLLLPKYLLTVTFQALLESSASEHGSRMTAMSNATDNAGKMIGELTLTANRVRQASITTEILEIVAGAEALKN